MKRLVDTCTPPAWLTHSIARTYLLLSSLVVLSLAIALTVVASLRIRGDVVRNALNTRDVGLAMTDAYILLTCLGFFAVTVSCLGVAGAFWTDSKPRILVTHFFCVLVAVFGFVYVTIMCYVSADADAATSTSISSYFDLLRTTVHTSLRIPLGKRVNGSYTALLGDVARTQDNLREAGGMSVATACLLFVSLWSSSRLASHEYMLTRVNIFLCSFGVVIASSMLALARHDNKSTGSTYATVVGAFMLPLSLIGVAAFITRKRWLSYVHLSCTLILVILTATLAGVCIASGDVQTPLTATLNYYDSCAVPETNSTVATCVQALAAQQFASEHLVLLGGLAAMTCVVLSIGFVGALHLAWCVTMESLKPQCAGDKVAVVEMSTGIPSSTSMRRGALKRRECDPDMEALLKGTE